MNKKSLATACVLAGAVFAAAARPAPAPSPAPIVNHVGTVSNIGTVDYTTDYLPGTDGNVTWTVPTTQPKNSYDVFTDTYDFTLLGANDVTGTAQAVGTNHQTFALTGNTGELQLYEGNYVAGHSLSSYTLVDQTSFGTSGGDSLTDHLAAGQYFFAVEGTTYAGAKGGRYYLEVTAVPEPAHAALLLAGLCLLGALAKRRKTS